MNPITRWLRRHIVYSPPVIKENVGKAARGIRGFNLDKRAKKGKPQFFSIVKKNLLEVLGR